MAWTTPKYDALFAERLITNLAAEVLASEAGALSWANGGSAMTAFKQPYRKSRWINTMWPTLSFILEDSNVPESDDESRIEEDHTVVVEIEDTGTDPDAISASVQKRVRAVTMIILNTSSAVLMAGYTKGGSLTKDVSKVDYRDFFNDTKSLYMRKATFTITFSFMETK